MDNFKMIKTKNWLQIRSFYNDLTKANQQYTELIALLDHIIANYTSDRIYGGTSLSTLIIGIYDPLIWQQETLHISLNTASKEWEFKYHPAPSQEPEHIRNYKTDLIENFERYLTYLKW